MKIKEFIEKTGITMNYQPAPENPNMQGDKNDMNHWYVTITHKNGNTISLYFSKGLAHYGYRTGNFRKGNTKWKRANIPYNVKNIKKWIEHENMDRLTQKFVPIPPDLEELLEHLQVEISGYDDSTTFEEWASMLGYDTDSRQAERIFHAVAKEAKDIRTLMGEDFSIFMNEVETD